MCRAAALLLSGDHRLPCDLLLQLGHQEWVVACCLNERWIGLELPHVNRQVERIRVEELDRQDRRPSLLNNVHGCCTDCLLVDRISIPRHEPCLALSTVPTVPRLLLLILEGGDLRRLIVVILFLGGAVLRNR